MCYEFILYTGCSHDRSLLYFRPLSQTTQCLCRSFSRLPPKPGLCPDCDRITKINRGLTVTPDPLTPQNRVKCQAWRELIDNEIKDRETKRASKEVTNEEDAFHVLNPSSKSKKRSESCKYKHNGRNKLGADSIVPPYVPQPGETFIEHIMVEVIDDAKSGGEMTRLEKALEAGVQGLGWIGPSGEESWLILSKECMEKHCGTMSIWTGKVGIKASAATPVPFTVDAAIAKPLDVLYEEKFPVFKPPAIEDPAIGIPVIMNDPSLGYDSLFDRKGLLLHTRRHNTMPTKQIGFESHRKFVSRAPVVHMTKPLIPGPPLGASLPPKLPPAVRPKVQHPSFFLERDDNESGITQQDGRSSAGGTPPIEQENGNSNTPAASSNTKAAKTTSVPKNHTTSRKPLNPKAKSYAAAAAHPLLGSTE
ncbi:hypothetical protein ABW20_dc0110527 [Dactylellina cionopaga]|nr:hypothetical protein ABW20_dc0110527 [Dactylellina cionopaga]